MAFWPGRMDAGGENAPNGGEWPDAALGHVVCLGGSQAVLALRTAEVRQGQMVKITGNDAIIFAVITALSTDNDGLLAEVELVGEAVTQGDSAAFHHGVQHHPTLHDFAFAVDAGDYGFLYDVDGIAMGRCAFDEGRTVFLPSFPNALALFGAHDTGKSRTLALYLERMLARDSHMQAIVFTISGGCRAPMARHLRVQDLPLPYWLLRSEELAALLVAHAGDEQPLSCLTASLRRLRGVEGEPYELTPFIEALRKGESACRMAAEALSALSREDDLSSLFPANIDKTALWRLLAQVFNEEARLTCLDFSTLPPSLAPVFATVYMRLCQDYRRISKATVPLVVAVENAETWVSDAALIRLLQDDGITTCLSASRPSDLDKTVLRQIQTALCFRLKAEKDRDALAEMAVDVNDGLLDPLPTLAKGEALWITSSSPHLQRLIVT